MLDPSQVYRPEACFDEYNEFISRTNKTSADFRNFEVCSTMTLGWRGVHFGQLYVSVHVHTKLFFLKKLNFEEHEPY